MNERLEQQDHHEWIEKIMEYKNRYPLTYHPEILTGPYIVEENYRQTKGDALIVTEVAAASDVGGTILSVYEAENIL